MSLPKGIQFKTVKPQGFYQEYRDYTVTPVQTYTNQFNTNDIIRIQFRIDDWYIDPYESYIEAEVRLRDETPINFANADSATIFTGTNPVQLLMMDGPSTSLINDFRLEINSVEVERTREYDQVGNLLTDLNLYPDAVDQKDYEGYYTIKGDQTLSSQTNYSSVYAANRFPASATNVSYFAVEESCPVFSQKLCYSAGGIGEPVLSYPDTIQTLAIQQVGTGISRIHHGNITQAFLDGTADTTQYSGNNPQSNSIQYLTALANDTRFSTGTSVTSLAQAFNYTQILGQYTSGNSNFGIFHADYVSQTGVVNGSRNGFLPIVNSPKLSQIDGHNIFLTNMPTSKIINGKFQKDPLYPNSAQNQQSRAYMQIPLLSGVMGVLIPSDRWQLIPTNSLGQVNMEFRFNDNAFFSFNGSIPQWIVTKFQLRLRMYRFDNALQAQLRSQVSAGIQMHSQNFSMGPIYSIQPNVSVTNNWQLNNGIPSVKQLFFWFLSNDYETYWHARKNYKVSQNVTSMQLKIGSTYIPQQPIVGHSGNIVMNSNINADNSVFLSELHQAMNLFFDCKKHININKLNFAINERPYDVTLATYLGRALTGGKATFMKEGGYAFWNEMRCRGKAVYAFNLEMDKTNDSTMSGLDTRKTRPIELILKSDDPNTYPRLSTMYVMFLNDFIVTFGDGNLTTEGQG